MNQTVDTADPARPAERRRTGFSDEGQNRSERVRALDGLRGLAAVSVVLAHLWSALPDSLHAVAPFSWAFYPPLTFLLNARGPVILFFVLSGYVLTLSLICSGAPLPEQILPFFVRRLCRIWLPYATAICGSALIGIALHLTGHFEHPDWELYWPMQFDPMYIFWQLMMRYTIPPLDPPGWSLVTELQVSMMFPLLVATVRRKPAVLLTFALGANMALEPANVQGFRFVLFFLIGALLALHERRVIQAAQPLLRHPGVTTTFCFFVLGLAPMHWWSEPLKGLGALGVIVLALASTGAARLLMQPPIQILGRVSFSLYLTHSVVIHALATWLASEWPTLWILAISVPIIFLVTWLTYVLVERPSTRLGAALAGRPGTFRVG